MNFKQATLEYFVSENDLASLNLGLDIQITTFGGNAVFKTVLHVSTRVGTFLLYISHLYYTERIDWQNT